MKKTRRPYVIELRKVGTNLVIILIAEAVLFPMYDGGRDERARVVNWVKNGAMVGPDAELGSFD